MPRINARSAHLFINFAGFFMEDGLRPYPEKVRKQEGVACISAVPVHYFLRFPPISYETWQGTPNLPENMNTDKMPVLPKWPFVIGDLIMIGTAVVIGVMADTPWSTAVLIAVLACVVLGAIVLFVPFLADYARKEQAELSERQRELAALVELCRGSTESAGIAAESLESFLREEQEHSRSWNEGVEHIHSQLAELKNELANADAIRKDFLKGQADISKVLAELKEMTKTVDGLDRQLQELRQSQHTLEQKIDHLSQAALHAQRTTEENSDKSTEAPAGLGKTEETEILPLEMDADNDTRDLRDEEEEHEPEEKETLEETPEVAAEDSEATDSQSENESPGEAPDDDSVKILDPADEKTEGSEASENHLPEEPQPPEEGELPPASPPRRQKAETKSKAVQKKHNDNTAELDLAWDDEGMSEPKVRKSLSSDNMTRLLVTAYIGISNKLFVRGDGAGLSWDKGVPLRFISIGKWGWESDTMDAPVHIKIYKNDEIECLSLGEVVLEPGHNHEVSAFF